MSAAVLVGADGALSDEAPATAQALLASLVAEEEEGGGDTKSGDAPAASRRRRRRACYTSALAVWSPEEEAYHVVDWHLHAERLVRDAARGGFSLSVGEAPPSSSLPALAAERGARALAALAAASSSSSSSSSRPPPPRAAMLVVALAPSAPPLLPIAYAKAAPPYAWALRQQDGGGNGPPLRAVAAVGAGGRADASRKHCRWVSERRALEAWAGRTAEGGAPFDEVLLVGERGEVLEGLVSNFYAIVERGEGEEEQRAAAAAAAAAAGGGGGRGGAAAGGGAGGEGSIADLSAFVLQTAGSEDPDSPALPGIVQRRVLEAAARLGLAVERRAPALAEAPCAAAGGGGGGGKTAGGGRRRRWREALVSSCVRGLAPVGSICVRRYDAGQVEQEEEEVEVALEPGPVGRLLAAEVLALQEKGRLR